MGTPLGVKDILSISQLSVEQIELILNRAKQMKERLQSDKRQFSALAGKSVITLFYENSTRTRMSFELAAKYLGGTVSNIAAQTSSVAKGESLADTGRTLERMNVDVIVLRHPCSGAAQLLAQNVPCSVINAGDGMHAHPSQALLDALTVQLHKGQIRDLKIAIIGDVLHSRVARSDTVIFSRLGAHVNVFAPPTLLPPGFDTLGCHICSSLEEAIDGADVLINLRIQTERQQSGLFPTVGEYARLYGMNMDRYKNAASDALIMHPGPMNRGIEISSEAADCDASCINEQVANGVAVRMALLEMLTAGKEKR